MQLLLSSADGMRAPARNGTFVVRWQGMCPYSIMREAGRAGTQNREREAFI